MSRSTSPDSLSPGDLLRRWRAERRLSQMALAHESGISPRHLSFIETGRSRAGRATLDRLASSLGLGLRQRNALMLAAGFAPPHARRTWTDPELADLTRALSQIVQAHQPFPALLMDARGDVLLANPSLLALVGDTATDAAPNVYRLALLPGPFSDRIVNRREWQSLLTAELIEHAARTGDPELAELAQQALAQQTGAMRPDPATDDDATTDGTAREDTAPVIPLVLRHGDMLLRLASIRTHLTAPREVLSSELSLETFIPLDDATRSALETISANH